MRGYGLFYFIAEAFRGLKANSLVNVLAVGTISMAMLIVGFFLIVFFNLQGAMKAMGDRLEMSVYLKSGLTASERDFILHRIKNEPGVKKVMYLPREEALANFKKELKGQESLIQGLGENPLPDSFEVLVERHAVESGRLAAMAARFAAFRGIDEVSYGKEGAEVLAGLYKAATYGGSALAVLLSVSVVFIISNSVRLALYSRGQEIELMQWIGATKGFIQGPFLIEGMMLAMLGSALAIGILAGVYYTLPAELMRYLAWPNGLDFLPMAVVAYLIIGGGLLGLAGGLVSVNQFLE